MTPVSQSPLRSELLMPAGSLAKLKIALLYGADAVYLGTPDMSLRSKSDFSLADVVEGVEFAHARGKRVYLTLNLFSHNKDIDKLPEYLETVRKVKPDGLIVADPGVFMFVREHAPELELHVSTQANVCSWQSVKFWQNLGAKLCVLGREVTFNELTEIREKCPDIKLETFVHGAMCMTYSGRCLLSNFMAERGANQGACANSCRWKYQLHLKLKDGTVKELNLTEENMELFEFLLEEEFRPGDLMPIEEDANGSYILNSKDLCMMPKLDDYLRLGVDSLKVEGRGKSLYYVALTARAYRMAMDDWAANPDGWSPKSYMNELATVPNRGYTLAFHDGRLTNYAHGYEETSTMADWEFAGMVVAAEDDRFVVEVKNRLDAGDVLDFVSPVSRTTMLLRAYEFENAETGAVTEVVHPGQNIKISLPYRLFDHEDQARLKERFPVMTIIRKERAMTEAEWGRHKLDAEARKLELGAGNAARYERDRVALRDELAEANVARSFKTPRLGIEGCCGKGCNGCNIFWHDPSYGTARKRLAEKKQGVYLEADGREDINGPWDRTSPQ